ncbi:M16 family metallopeptidase [Streptomyces sp. NRRL B-3229]|uniref:M16 family metallopeptidase n=1 Tax=Streptomyces sp. NRRL B-3229 TaxID=1463836 RepID=UPI00131B4BAF|nr:pitrilysin family protein [Streptomyces sp. NRRL B-3229]
MQPVAQRGDHLLEQLSTHLVVDDRLRTAGICLAVDYGARNDPDGRGGLAHCLEHLLMAYPVNAGGSLSEHVERLGGNANAETGLEHMLFHAQVLAEDTEKVLALLQDAIWRPQHDADLVDSELEVVLQELAAAAADPLDVVQDAFLADLFPGHPLGRPVGGSVDEVRSLGIADIAAGHQEYFLPSRGALVVVAPEAPAGLPAGATVGGPQSIAPRRTVPQPLGRVAHRSPAWPDTFTWVSVGGRSAAAGAPGSHSYQVLAELFGGSPSSPLYRTLRGERGLAYSFQAWHRGYTEAGAWRILVGTDAGKGEEVVDVVTEALGTMARGGPARDDLLAARKQARSKIRFGLESPLAHARLLARHSVADPSWTVEGEEAALVAVTAEEIAASAANILDDLVVTIYPEKS